jgi:hypothetical protein
MTGKKLTIGDPMGFSANTLHDGKTPVAVVFGIRQHREVTEVTNDPGLPMARLLSAAGETRDALAALLAEVEAVLTLPAGPSRDRLIRLAVDEAGLLKAARAALEKADGPVGPGYAEKVIAATKGGRNP